MPSLIGTDLTKNYQVTKPTTKFGTRELAYFQVDMGTDVATDYALPNSLYSKAVRGLQSRVEIYGVGVPSGSNFTVIAAADTAAFDAGHSNQDRLRVTLLEEAINQATNLSGVAVWSGLLTGWSIDNNC